MKREPTLSQLDDDTGAVRSLRKALAVLECIGSSRTPPRIAEVAIAVGISRPTAYRIVNTLIAEGYVTQDVQSGRLSIGHSVLMLSASLLDSNRLRLESLPHLESLAELTGERTNLGIIHRHKVLYIAGVEKPSLPTIYTRFGKTAPAHCSSLGKAILAHLPPVEVERILCAEPLIASTPNSITTAIKLHEELAETRGRGYALDRQEHEIGSCCVAAPIFGDGGVIGAIGISSQAIEPLLEQVDVLRHTAEVISHRLAVRVRSHE
ncbi:MAG: IclR family transcriptional regulator [Rhizobiaceae bacterium]|nr:IclR family transcriptional regulator [Rhizobiaceae bacterium]